MLLELNDTIIQSTGLTDEQLRLELALQLYQDNKISLGQGGELSGLGSIRFQQELGKRKIFLNYSIGDLQHDIDTLHRTSPL